MSAPPVQKLYVFNTIYIIAWLCRIVNIFHNIIWLHNIICCLFRQICFDMRHIDTASGDFGCVYFDNFAVFQVTKMAFASPLGCVILDNAVLCGRLWSVI